MARHYTIGLADDAINHLKAIMETGCDPAGESRCNWCDAPWLYPFHGEKTYKHSDDCVWHKAKEFLDSLKS